LTLSRFFVLHVFLIPLGLLAFVGAHLFLFRKAGPAGPPNAASSQEKVGIFYPTQVVLDAAFALLLIIMLALLAHFIPKGLGPSVNPADTAFIPRPEWYYRPLFQWLKYWEGPLVIIGILVIPGIIAALFVGLPFYDRRPERRPLRRPIAVGTFCFVLGALIVLGIVSYRVDNKDPAVAAQLERQDQAEKQFVHEPFQPEVTKGSTRSSTPAAGAAASPLVAKGKQIFESQGCVVCHGEGAVGTAMAIKLVGVGQRLAPVQLANLIRHPNAKMKAGGMPSFPLSNDDMKSLTTYLDSLK
ncbi:MAG: cytochrome b N-terminal domain-containing protein, partial [Terriglobia bacterium]